MMTDKQLREILAQEVEKDKTHFVQIPHGLRSGNDEEFWAWRVLINAALSAMRRVAANES